MMKILIMTFAMVGLWLTAASQPVIHFAGEREVFDIGKSLYYHVDEMGTLEVQDLIHLGNERYMAFEGGSPSIGISDAALWCKFKVRNDVEQDVYLDIENSALDSISLYEILPGGSVTERRSGVTLSYQDRELSNNNYVLRLCGKSDMERTFFLRVRHSRGTQFTVFAGTIKGLAEKFHRDDFIMGIYFGSMLVMIFYNLFIYFSVKDSTYLFYVLYVGCMAVLNASLGGYGAEYIWRDFPAFSQYEDLLSASLGISGILFATRFLQTRQNVPLIHRAFQVILVLYIVGIGMVLGRWFMMGTIYIEFLSLGLIAVFILAAVTTIRKGYRPARFFLAAWGVLLLGVVVFILKDFQLLPINSLTLHSLEIGSSVEAAVLSLALANRINTYKNEKDAAQAAALESLRANEKLILEQKVVLEAEVKRRTGELVEEKRKSEELLLNILPQDTAEELKRTGRTQAKRFDEVTVMFTDFVGFTSMAERLQPEQLIAEINHCFTEFDAIMQKYNVEKIKTIGDSYMCAAGLTTRDDHHAVKVVHAALEMQHFLQRHSETVLERYGIGLAMRLGIHTGPVVAGVVGTKKFAYDIWGDTVNIASRMESAGVPGRVNISGVTLEAIKNNFLTSYRGKLEAKHKGSIDMYIVEGVNGHDPKGG